MWNTRREDQVPAGILPYLQWDHAWFHAYVYGPKRLRPFYRQRLKTTRQVVRCVRLKRTVWYLFWQNGLNFTFPQSRIHFQAERAPFTAHLITIYHSHSKTVHISFSALNASNQGCHVKKTLFFSTFSYTRRYTHGFFCFPFDRYQHSMCLDHYWLAFIR